jgi:hypothetical protein
VGSQEVGGAQNLQSYQNINIEPLKNCKNLNHLELNVYHLSRKTFEDIDLYLPNLKTIVIYLNYSFRND